MAEIQRYNLVQKLEEADKNLMGSPSLLGMSMLTYPSYINAMRGTMFTSHIKQYLNLKNGLFPKVFTNTENLVGDNSNGYKRAKHDLKIINKVVKYDSIIDNPQIYKLFVYDKTTHTYDVIERRPCESLAENFGFDIVNDVIDEFDVGDIIPKDQVYMKSTSYDEDMNYSYGRNVTVAYTLDPFSSEDAAIASESFCKDFTSIETEDITVNLNGNDYLLNLYGEKDEYKVIPDIGEFTSDILCASRRQFNNQLLYDFKESSLREIHEGDNVYYVDKEEEIVDITIYSNVSDIAETSFNRQLLKYLKAQNEYYLKIYQICKKIRDKCKESDGKEKYSRELDYLYSRAKLFLDTDKKWVDADQFSGDMQIVITVRRDAPITKGCKVTGKHICSFKTSLIAGTPCLGQSAANAYYNNK